MRPSPRIRGILACATLLTAVACGGDGTKKDDDMVAQVTSVTISPGATTLESLGATVTLSATAKDATGATLNGATITWSSSNDLVATVSASGEVTAQSNGTATISALAATSQASATGQVVITVDQKAAAVELTAPEDTLRAGETMQLSAAAADGGGTVILDPAFTWSSSDDDVATVDGDGLVTGVGAGEATLSASLDGASAQAPVTVLFVSVEVANDTTLTGTVVADTFTVATGVTVTATEDFVLRATGPVSIAGTVTGDCVAMSVEGQDDVSITGTLSNACSDTTAAGQGVTIRANGALSLTGVSITTSGSVVVANADEQGEGVEGLFTRPLTRPRATAADSPCEFRSVAMAWNPLKETDGDDGKDLIIRCLGEATFWGGNGFQAQHGGDGDWDTDEEWAEGDDGGDGGSVRIDVVEGDMIFYAEAHDGITGTEFVAGDGGKGGWADAEAEEPGADAEADGGDGGEGGHVSLQTFNGSIKVMEFNALSTYIGQGGDGGDADAEGGDGKDAGTEAAQKGGNADSNGGEGGDGGSVMVTTIAGSLEGVGNIVQTGGSGGDGGDATSDAGDGGNGNADFPDGAEGGANDLDAGDGGEASRPHGGGYLGNGGDGGDTFAYGAKGGNGADMCPAGVGGNGGKGGETDSETGEGGDGLSDGADGVEEVDDHTSDGGNGGAGLTPGAGGEAGDDLAEEDWPDAFHDGLPGGGCIVEADLSVEVTVLSDPAGHNPYVEMYLVSSLHVSIEGSTITITGASPWIGLSGTTDGTNFSVSGSGDAAGFSNVSTTFEGTITRDESGNITGISGTLTVGVNGELYGTAISYTVTG